MRLVLHNPQMESFFGATFYNFLTKRFSFRKYFHVLREFLSDESNELGIYYDQGASSLPFPFSKLFPTKWEIFFWLKINGISPKKVKVFNDTDEFNPKDVLFSFLVFFNDPSINFEKLQKIDCAKVFHTTHYQYGTSFLAQKLSKISNYWLIGEGDLFKNSPFFRKYFDFYRKNVYVIPFAFKERFQRVNPSFLMRSNKCIATGTFELLNDNNPRCRELMDFFGTDTYHPVRKLIYDNPDAISGFIDSFVSEYNSDMGFKKISQTDSLPITLLKRIYNGYFARRRNYYRFDIVDKYNSYRMFMAPEEIVGFPGIGFVEGMACGCAYLGKEDPMYSDLGMVAGVHYIAHDGSIEGILGKIEYYQGHPLELESIAQAGYDLVRENMNPENISRKFLSDLKSLSESGGTRFPNSFVYAM